MKKIYALLIALASGAVLIAQPAGWSYVVPLDVQNNTALLVTDYQLRFTFDTQTPIGAGQMNATGDDIRFGKDCAGTTLFNYWIESGINSASTVLWVKIDSLPASGTIQIYMFHGNASAPPASAVMGTFIGPHSSTDSVVPVNNGGVGNSQRGFRFAPTEDILMTHVGKYEPTGTTRTITLFNFSTQAILRQEQVGGPAAQYTYNPMANPIWLTQGTQYLLEMFQGPSDGYYFGTSSQIGQHMTYYDMRYCNSCTQNTFPTNVLGNYQYGQPDMWYFTKLTIPTIPTVTIGTIGSGTLVTSTSGSVSVCPGDSAFVSITASGGTGSYSYNWLPTTGMANPNAASTMVLPPTSGMYYCIVTDQCGNSNFDSLYVTINTPPTVAASVSTDSVCIGGSFIPTGSGAVSYSWTGGLTDGVAFFPTATSNYTVTGTDINGCTNIAIATVEVVSLPVVVASATDDSVCSGTAVTLNGSGASTYTWDNGVTDGLSFTPGSTLMYIVIGTDATGCQNTDSITVVVNAAPNVLTSSTGSPYCAGTGSALLQASGATSHFWVTPGVTSDTITVSPSVTTTYTVIGTDAVGCADTATITVTVNPNPSLAVTGGTSCAGDCITFQSIVTGGTPGYSYLWNPSAGLNNPTIGNPIACNGTTTCYTVIVTDTMGCVDAITNVCHIVTPLPDVTLSGPTTTCVNDGSYTLVGIPVGGTFTGPGVTGTLFSPSAAGTGTHMIIYSFTDANGCTAADTLTIVVSACVGITDNTELNGVSVYPNPFSDAFVVDLTQTGVAMVRMTNSLGQVVFEQEMNEGRTEISTEHLTAGVYFLEVTSEKGTRVIKVVKN